ncbi:MAG TPA: cytochrome c oxidase subunit 3 [Saprospiraceae bacterium]|nr:cytochrome c oxidase subunit 3 [Saprospiraceae bacterium]
MNKFQFFPFHLVDPSPWPILLSFSLLNLTIGAVAYMHGFSYGGYILTLGFILTTYGMILWFRDVVVEATYLGHHTKEVKNGLMIGVLLFIVSEIFAFLSVFWAFFHSSLSPAIEIGGTWPPLGITPLDPFAIPLLNTFLLLSSGAFITYGHHALIAGNRKAAIDGVIFTIILAIIFTGLQYFEYSEAGFTMSDGVYGSAFYASTGLHGLTTIVPIKFNNINTYMNKPKEKLLIKMPNNRNFIKKSETQFTSLQKEIYLDSEFLEWFSGFTDAEGNFNITLQKLKENNYTNAMLTFQIGLHIDDLSLLEYIKNKLNCGHISITTSRCNYFVNDKTSLIQVILPIFNFIKLNSSKYYQFLIFEKAVNLIKEKKHLSPEGKLEMVKFYKEMKISSCKQAPASQSKEINNIPLTINWLGGFTDGDSTFSIFKYKPRIRFENHIKELNLFERIKDLFNIRSNFIFNKPRLNRPNSNATVSLDITNIQILKNKIVPIFSKSGILKSKKLKDFNDWSIIVDIYYYGYHLIPEGKALITEIKNQWNNFRLSTSFVNKKNNLTISSTSLTFDEKLKNLFLIPSPYEIKNGIRFIRGTNNFVSESLKIIAFDNFNNKSIYSSITECSNALNIDRSKIKNCILTGEVYKNYKFILAQGE